MVSTPSGVNLARKTSKTSERQNMTMTIEYVDTAATQRPALAALRLRLKPAHRSCGYVQGAWWPRSTRLAGELPSLLEALSLRFGMIDRIRYHENDWPPTPPSIKHRGADVILDASQESPNVITAFGREFGKLTLLVIPPRTDAADAHAAMSAASNSGDVSAPDQLLGLDHHIGKDRRHALSALQRWESDSRALRAAKG
ncbi:DUF5994 family protein [Mycobacterium shimoidei]|uniref:DUF5994 family protein n=1 Tax=Mycobacterium shimoidei TaxID=29313 RepID=UPI001E61F231|nr:DUF5994 family protein [Mycobacterium shimoidei]